MSLLTNTEYKLNKYVAETMIYFERHKLIEIVKKIFVECALIKPSEPQEWIGKNIKRISNEIYQDCLKQGTNNIIKSLYLSKNFVYRIVMFGRPGSGRKTQATNLVSRFNVVLIDVEKLIYQHLRGDDEHPNEHLDRELQRAFYYDNCPSKSKSVLNIIAKRLLEKDCLTRGWVLVNYPHTVEDFKNILENFIIPPNKLIYLKCSDIICMRRLTSMPNFNKPGLTYSYCKQEMRYFNQQKEEIDKYLFERHETIYVNAVYTSKDVRTEMLCYLVKTPYVVGFK